jgi:hypothetical protein
LSTPVALDLLRVSRLTPAASASAALVLFALCPQMRERATWPLPCASGVWDARHGHLRSQPAYEGGLRLVVARPS